MTTIIKSLQQSKSKTQIPVSPPSSSSTTTTISEPSEGSELSVTTIIEPPSPYPSPSHSSVYTRKSQSDLSERHARTLAVGNQLEIPMNVRDLRRHSASDLGKTSKVVAQAIPEHEVVNSARMEHNQQQQQGKYNKNEPRKSTSDVKADLMAGDSEGKNKQRGMSRSQSMGQMRRKHSTLKNLGIFK